MIELIGELFLTFPKLTQNSLQVLELSNQFLVVHLFVAGRVQGVPDHATRVLDQSEGKIN